MKKAIQLLALLPVLLFSSCQTSKKDVTPEEPTMADVIGKWHFVSEDIDFQGIRTMDNRIGSSGYESDNYTLTLTSDGKFTSDMFLYVDGASPYGIPAGSTMSGTYTLEGKYLVLKWGKRTNQAFYEHKFYYNTVVKNNKLTLFIDLETVKKTIVNSSFPDTEAYSYQVLLSNRTRNNVTYKFDKK
ncbi:hypothetical protein GVN16_03395 [Emticicia sp. CRIBPO]|uniref:hypothetical protein n=1 Tax=Emticicia sp. CRIBPO TaxID=2683258 RepID=UPI00141345A4|nr:hypothetical protein [Emticicia sp. CRIBPO]NBA84785.1 hypothetical protein [Emticicia sp. CRIBPO]